MRTPQVRQSDGERSFAKHPQRRAVLAGVAYNACRVHAFVGCREVTDTVAAMSYARRRLRCGLGWLRRHVARWGRQPTAPTPTQSSASRADPPLSPVYPFNDPGQSIVLHDGPIGGLATTDVPGVVELSCVPVLNLAWRIKDGSDTGIPGDEVTLLLRRPDGDVQLPGWRRESDEGWSNGAEIGKADAPLKRIVAHWFNLPDFHARLGRWEAETDGWNVTLDVGPTMIGSARACCIREQHRRSVLAVEDGHRWR